MTTREIPPEIDPNLVEDDEPIHPAGGTCRGCGGRGLDHDVSPRMAQLIDFGLRFLPFRDPVAGVNHRERYVRLARHTYRKQGVFHGPYAMCLRETEDLLARGFTLDDPQVQWPANGACSWCGGTGTPGLSLATLENELRARGQVR